MPYLLTQTITNGAEQHPERDAFRFNGKSLTYEQLELQSNRLAWTLLDQGVERGDRVGIYMNKGLESAVALYGIMKAGAAYVPLDAFAPVERLAYVIRDCNIQRIVTSSTKARTLPELLDAAGIVECAIGIQPDENEAARFITWDQVWQEPKSSLPGVRTIEQDLAYILYTSGSTGVPKGIIHTHRSGLSFAEWACQTYELRGADRVSNHAPLHFDLSTFDLFASALAGSTTVIIPEALTKFPANIAGLIDQEQISVWYSVPYALIQLLTRGGIESVDLTSLRWVIFAGEPFPTKHLRELMKHISWAQFSNLYGPTETNVCTYYHVSPLSEDDDKPIPIGIPCENTDALVLDADDKEVAVGEPGELLIRGPVVMRGYWGRPDLTEEGFHSRSVFPDYDETYYRTGDLVQLDHNGDYLYLGRKDRQIKTRGYRVELDEIEVTLLNNDAVHEVAVYPIPDGEGSNLIEAAVIAKDAGLTQSELLDYLAEFLPAYAIPAHIRFLDTLPRTSTGKINRRQLQADSPGRAEQS